MDKEKAIKTLEKLDLEIVKEELKHSNKIVYWKGGKDSNHESQLWFIDGNELIDYLCYYVETYLHWTQLYESVIELIKKNFKYEIDESW